MARVMATYSMIVGSSSIFRIVLTLAALLSSRGKDFNSGHGTRVSEFFGEAAERRKGCGRSDWRGETAAAGLILLVMGR